MIDLLEPLHFHLQWNHLQSPPSLYQHLQNLLPFLSLEKYLTHLASLHLLYCCLHWKYRHYQHQSKAHLLLKEVQCHQPATREVALWQLEKTLFDPLKTPLRHF